LVVFDDGNRPHAISGLVDTGFNGWMTLPSKVITSLGLPWQKDAYGVLADGGTTFFNVFSAQIDWDGQRRTVYVSELDGDSLIGMQLLNGFRLTVDAIDGGAVQIDQL
jgi:clan AA aspartic protease